MKYLFIVFFLVMFIGLVDATEKSLPNPIKSGDKITLVQTCANCTYVNVTTLKYPNSTIVNLNVKMASYGKDYYYTINESYGTDSGIYAYTTCGNPDAITVCEPVSFTVNPLGKETSSSQSTMYMIIFVVALLIFVGTLVSAILLPSDNKRDDLTGYILSVSNLKYLKIFLYALSYVILIILLYFGWMICYAYLDMPFMSQLMHFAYIGSIILLLPLFIIGVFIVISNYIRDSKIHEFMLRGLRVK